MADINFAGSVVGFGGSAGRSLPVLDLHYEIRIAVPVADFNQSGGFSQGGNVQTRSNGPFSVTLTVPDEIIRIAGRLIISVQAFVPPANRRDAEFSLLLEGTAQEKLDLIAQAAQALVVEVDLSNCTTLNIYARMREEVDALEDINELSLQLLSTFTSSSSSVMCFASAPARRNGDSFNGALVCLTGMVGFRPTWILLQGRGARPPRQVVLDQTSVDRVFVRTRALTSITAFEDAGEVILFEQIDQKIGVGSLSEELPEEINEGVLGARDPDLDFVDGNIRLKGRVVFTVNGTDILGAGRFEVFLGLRIIDRDLLPCRPVEFDRPIAVDIISHSYDLFPDTDLDRFNVTQSMLEGFISETVAERLRDEVATRIRDRFNDKVDDPFDELSEQLQSISSDPDAITSEVRNTLFFHVDRAVLDADDLRLRMFVGLWHGLNNLIDIDCPAKTAAIMFSSMRPLPMFRRYEKALSKKQLLPWMKIFRKHSKELAGIVARDPSLTGQLVRLAFDLQPILAAKAKVPLSSNAVERLVELLEVAQKQASAELVEVINRAIRVFKDGVGHHFEELLEIAAANAPAQK